MDYVNEDGEIIHVKLPDPAPERDVFAWPGVGEPELKWCETICHEAAYANEFVGYQMSRANYKSILMAETNLAEERIERALTVLYMQKRI